MSQNPSALVVGITDYLYANQLSNAKNDAEDISQALDELGFSVSKQINVNIENLDRAIERFIDSLNSSLVGGFYFAGHGVQIDGENYLIAKDTQITDLSSVKYQSYSLNRLIEAMHSSSSRTNIIILDACRDTPLFLKTRSTINPHELAVSNAPLGTLIGFATSPGQTALDGTGRNGRYTEALLAHIKTPDIPIEEFFKRVRNTLITSTGRRQISWEHTSLTGDFRFCVSASAAINIYSKAVRADKNFAITLNDTVSSAITKLRSHNWYTQNSGISELTIRDLSESSNDLLFVLGRNIYQAACGGANDAIDFINNAKAKIGNIPTEKRKSIIDGMFFEVFFDPEGEIRNIFKTTEMKSLFNLREHNKGDLFLPSFEFISDVLIPHRNRLYILPKMYSSINLDVMTEPTTDGNHKVTQILFEGINILKCDANTSTYFMPYNRFMDFLAKEIIYPKNKINITGIKNDDSFRILMPINGTLRK